MCVHVCVFLCVSVYARVLHTQCRSLVGERSVPIHVTMPHPISSAPGQAMPQRCLHTLVAHISLPRLSRGWVSRIWDCACLRGCLPVLKRGLEPIYPPHCFPFFLLLSPETPDSGALHR